MKQNIKTTQSNNFVVTQSNQLVEANYSSNLTTLSHKVAKLILGFIHPEKEQKELSITIEISKLKQYLGWSPTTKWNRFYSDLKDISKRLNKEPIEIALDDNKVLVAYFLSSYILDVKKGEVTFDISPKLIPHLVQLKKNFTSYQLKYIPALSSSYAIRMYELFYQYLKIGKRKFTLEDFVKKVGAPPKYKYNDLKKRVLIPAQKQLRENTNIAFIFNEHKAGRKIVGLEFIIYGNTPSKNSKQIELDFLTDVLEEDSEPPIFSENIIEAMTKLGIKEQTIAKYLALGFDIIEEPKREKAKKRFKNLEDYYLEKLELTKLSSSTNNAAGFLVKALKEDWQNSKTAKTVKAQDTLNKRKETKEQHEKISMQINKLKAQREAIKSPIIENLLLDDVILKTAYDSAIAGLGDFMKKHYMEILNLPINEQREKGMAISSGMNAYLMKTYPEKFENVIKLEDEIKEANQKLKRIKV